MTDYFLAPFLDNGFMQLAFWAGMVTAVICAIAGTFIVLRGLAFIGDALAHGVLPGIAAATLLGVSTIVGAAVGAAVLVGGVGLITRRTRLSSDTAIGLLFVGMLALGVIMTSPNSVRRIARSRYTSTFLDDCGHGGGRSRDNCVQASLHVAVY